MTQLCGQVKCCCKVGGGNIVAGGWGCGDKEGKGKEGAAEYSQAKCNTWGGAIRTLNTSEWSALIWQDKRSPDKHFEQVVEAQQRLSQS